MKTTVNKARIVAVLALSLPLACATPGTTDLNLSQQEVATPGIMRLALAAKADECADLGERLSTALQLPKRLLFGGSTTHERRLRATQNQAERLGCQLD